MSYNCSVALKVERPIGMKHENLISLFDSLLEHYGCPYHVEQAFDKVIENGTETIIYSPFINWTDLTPEFQAMQDLMQALDTIRDERAGAFHYIVLGEDWNDNEEIIHGDLQNPLETIREIKF